MAGAGVVRDDLEEMLREEAEDVFYEDGRLRGRPGGLLGQTAVNLMAVAVVWGGG